jgi:RNA polymerase sigma-70 factor (ECF subfamily)
LTVSVPREQFAIDENLVLRAKEGDPGALEELYRRYATRLHGYCYRLTGSSQAAEDIVQDVFVKVAEGIRELAHPGAFRTWVFRIARNEALMLLRKRRNGQEVDGDSVWDEATPLSILISTEATQVVQSFLQRMKLEYRDVLILREYEQRTYAEIAEITGTTESAVKSRLFKARKALAKELTPFFREGRIR